MCGPEVWAREGTRTYLNLRPTISPGCIAHQPFHQGCARCHSSCRNRSSNTQTITWNMNFSGVPIMLAMQKCKIFAQVQQTLLPCSRLIEPIHDVISSFCSSHWLCCRVQPSLPSAQLLFPGWFLPSLGFRLRQCHDAMNHHFASSWLKSLSNKLDSLVEWSWVAERHLSSQEWSRDSYFTSLFVQRFLNTRDNSVEHHADTV